MALVESPRTEAFREAVGELLATVTIFPEEPNWVGSNVDSVMVRQHFVAGSEDRVVVDCWPPSSVRAVDMQDLGLAAVADGANYVLVVSLIGSAH